jgi:thioredoxin reductase (NADPH)
MVDVIIVGGGPAGLSASITARQRNHSAVIISNDFRDSKLFKAGKIDNYPGLPGVSGAELLDKLTAHARDAGVDLITGKVSTILPTGTTFQVGYDSGILMSKSIVLTIGVTPTSLFPGEEEFLGRGVSYCATCDGLLYKGKRVCVICLIPGAYDEAVYLASLGCDVVRITSNNIRINGQNKVTSVTVDSEEINCDGVFIIREAIAPNLLLSGLETVGGFISVTASGETNLPGVYAAGDCVGTPHQISKAVGQGLVAALSASAYIREHS